MKSSLAEQISEAAHEAAVREVMTAPKPGLVDAEGSGCHEDMDCALFIKSAEALAPYWRRQAEAGLRLCSAKEMMQSLRRTGVEMERAMFEATCGINTHKGLIYLMSLLVCGAASAAAQDGFSPQAAAARASQTAAGTVAAELEPLRAAPVGRKLSNGENLFVSHGVTGIRGEAERGFPSVIRCGLPAYEKAIARGSCGNDAGISALLAIMSVCEDSNVMHRGGYAYWKNEYLPAAAAAYAAFSAEAASCGRYEMLYEMERRFMPRRISPGGAADLLSCTYFLEICKNL